MPRQTVFKPIAVVAVIILVLMVLYFMRVNSPFTNQQTSPPKTSNQSSQEDLPKIDTIQGNVVSVGKNGFSIKTGSKTKTFTLAERANIQKVAGGSADGPNTKVETVNISNLAVGQEVWVVGEKDSSVATSVLIIK